MEQSYVIGRLLRSRKAVARVGRTIATACAAGTQVDAACLRTKAAGGEVEAELTTYHAMCNSACGYLFLGATSREVAPDAALAVHNSRLVFVFHGHPARRRSRNTGSAGSRTPTATALRLSRRWGSAARSTVSSVP